MKNYLTVKEAAEKYGYNEDYLRRKLKNEGVKYIALGPNGHRRYLEADLDDYLGNGEL